MAEWAAYFLKHQGESKMVGKVFEISLGPRDSIPICVHESDEDQHMWIYNSPGGVDAPLMEKLLADKVPVYIHRYTANGFSWKIFTSDLVRTKRQWHDGRDRFFPTYDDYEKYPKLSLPWVIPEIKLKPQEHYPHIEAALGATV